MTQTTVANYEIIYKESSDEVRVLINREYLATWNISSSISLSNPIFGFDDTSALVVPARRLVKQEVGPAIFDADDDEYYEGDLNYNLDDDDLTAYYAGEVENLELVFELPQQRLFFAGDFRGRVLRFNLLTTGALAFI